MLVAMVLVPILYLVVSALALSVNLVAFSVRRISGRGHEDYRRYYQISAILIVLAFVLICIVGILSFFGKSMTPPVGVNSDPVVVGIILNGLGIITMMANVCRSPR